MDNMMHDRLIRVCLRFLKQREYQVMDTWEHQAFRGIIAKDHDDALIFTQVLCETAEDEGLPNESSIDRHKLEMLATDWLCEHSNDIREAQIRFDTISVMVLSEDRAFLRHHINALSQTSC